MAASTDMPSFRCGPFTESRKSHNTIASHTKHDMMADVESKKGASPEVAEKPAPPPDEQPDTTSSPATPPTWWRRLFPPAARAWIILFAHGGACIALAMSMSFGLDGYQAGDESTPRTAGRKLLLRVSDVTTLVSVSLVVIKAVTGAFSALALWAAAQHMLSKRNIPESSGAVTKDPKQRARVVNMLRWKLPPWLSGRKILISLATFALFVQQYTGPLLTGAVDWNVGQKLVGDAIPVSSVNPASRPDQWYWYNTQGSFDKRVYLRHAAGYAGTAWADPTTVDAKGKSVSGNGCRHVVNSNPGLPTGSELVDATLPCINIHSINWFRAVKDFPTKDYWDYVVTHGDNITLVNDNPFTYYWGGAAFIYNRSQLVRPYTDANAPPPASVFSGTLTVALMTERQNISTPSCTGLTNTKFGNIDAFPAVKVSAWSSSAHENCFLVGQINFTAGVTKSQRATYLSPRLVEDQTPLEAVKFEANPWVREAIWWLPDLMPLLATTNLSQIPTFNNVDGYVEGLVRQAYLGAWDMLSRGFEDKGPTYGGYAAEARLVASVRLARVFAWMALCLLVSVFGALLLGFVLEKEDFVGTEPEGEETGIVDEVMEALGD